MTDLIPFTTYNINISACTSNACISTGFIQTRTNEHQIQEFCNPIVYILNETTVDIVWHEPLQKNGLLTSYLLFRNNLPLVEFNLSSKIPIFEYKLGFYKYTDSTLEPNSFYSYKLKVSNLNFSLFTENVLVQTPPFKLLKQCPNQLKLTSNNSFIQLFNILSVYFQVNTSNSILITYETNEWKNLISCLSGSLDRSSFSIKILLQSQTKGLQSLDFPYPSSQDLNNKTNVQFEISGLLPFNNYSIRLSFTTIYPTSQILTTEPVYLQTLEQTACCSIPPPILIKQNFSQTFSVRWKLPNHPNGVVNRFSLIRSRLKGFGCSLDLDMENSIELENKYFYDQTNSQFVFKDSDPELINYFSYYVYKIVFFNSKGKLESNLSRPELSWQTREPSPPMDLKVSAVHSTGFKLKFLEPNFFNGILEFYLIKISLLNSLDSQEIILKPNKTCDSLDPKQIEVSINGLDSFKTFNVTIQAVNQLGLKSKESDFVIANTLESTPKYLRSLFAEPIKFQNATQGILFKFQDPEVLNGILKSFNLYTSNLDLVYTGLSREFVYSNLDAYTNYSFTYEACTSVACTRWKSILTIQTFEALPDDQLEPKTTRTDSGCFRVMFNLPQRPNGIILYQEIYRLETYVDNLNLKREILIQNVTNSSKTFLDCDLKANFYYSYKIVSFNSQGSVSSNYSIALVSNLSLPQGFYPLKALELNESLIRIEWTQPKFVFGGIKSYKLIRNESILKISNLSFTFLDKFDFIPNTVYRYELFACNQAGCSSDENSSCLIKTSDQAPLKVTKPLLTRLSSTTATLNASSSVYLKSNQTQKIIEYKYYLNEILVYQGVRSVITLENLTPFTNYTINLEACTFQTLGCTKSSEFLYFQTNQSAPSGLLNLKFSNFAIDDFNAQVNISWSEPMYPNGVLRLIELKRDNNLIFTTRNMSIKWFVEFNLRYAQNYTYELSYFNDMASVRVINSHFTMEYFPVLLENPICTNSTQSSINLTWSKPFYSNGIILFYEIKFKLNTQNEWKSIKILNQTSLVINNLSPNSRYEFQIGACNRVGCGYGRIVRDLNCSTLERVQIKIDSPEVIEMTELNQVDLLIKWKFYPGNYSLYRLGVQNSIAYDFEYKPKSGVLSKQEIYTGKELSYVDKNMGWFNVFEYILEVRTQFGSFVSLAKRFRTRASEPRLLIRIGSLNTVTNQSVSLSLRPPLNINGELRNVMVVIREEDQSQKEIPIYSNSMNLNAFGLLKYLENVSVAGLQADRVYEIRSKFCNQISCLTSLQAIKFKTLMNDRIEFFEANSLAPNNIEFKWNFRFGNPILSKQIRFVI